MKFILSMIMQQVQEKVRFTVAIASC